MARAHFVKKARTDIYETGVRVEAKNKAGHRYDKSQPNSPGDQLLVRKGESYYWWQLRFGPKHVSRDAPRPQQLTNSEFQIRVYDFIDTVNAIDANPDTIVDEIESLASDIREFAEEQEEKLNNMPDSLQSGDVALMLQERADSLNEAADELDNIITEELPGEPDEDADEAEKSEALADRQEAVDDMLARAQDAVGQISG